MTIAKRESRQDCLNDDCDNRITHDEWKYTPHHRPYCPDCGTICEDAQRELMAGKPVVLPEERMRNEKNRNGE